MNAWWLWIAVVSCIVLDPKRVADAQDHIKLFRQILARQSANGHDSPYTSPPSTNTTSPSESPPLFPTNTESSSSSLPEVITTNTVTITQTATQTIQAKAISAKEKEPVKESVKEPVKESVKEPGKEPVEEASQETSKEAAKTIQSKTTDPPTILFQTAGTVQVKVQPNQMKEPMPSRVPFKLKIGAPEFAFPKNKPSSNRPTKIVPGEAEGPTQNSGQTVPISSTIPRLKVEQKVSHGLGKLLNNQGSNHTFDFESVLKDDTEPTDVDTDAKTEIENNKENDEEDNEKEQDTMPRHSNLRSVLEGQKLSKSFHKQTKPQHRDIYPEPPAVVAKISYKNLFDLKTTPAIEKENKFVPPSLQVEELDTLIRAVAENDNFQPILEGLDENIKNYVKYITPDRDQENTPASKSNEDQKAEVQLNATEYLMVPESTNREMAMSPFRNDKEPKEPRKQKDFNSGWFQSFALKVFGKTKKNAPDSLQASAAQKETCPSIIGVVIFVMYAIFL